MAGERGRPRTFDMDSALDKAVEVFWKHGFQDASMQELTTAMGLSKPSVYAAFGDKEALYLKALQRYAAFLVARHGALLNDEPDGRRAVSGFLHSMASMFADPELPGGCFVVNGSADCGGLSIPPSVEAALLGAIQATEATLQQRLERASSDGQLAASARPADLASFFMSVIAGMGVMAKGGAGVAKLNAVIDSAMLAWRDN